MFLALRVFFCVGLCSLFMCDRVRLRVHLSMDVLGVERYAWTVAAPKGWLFTERPRILFPHRTVAEQTMCLCSTRCRRPGARVVCAFREGSSMWCTRTRGQPIEEYRYRSNAAERLQPASIVDPDLCVIQHRLA